MPSLGMQEIIVIFVLALIVFGPRKLPELGKSLGKSLAEFKKASNELKQTWEDEVAKEKETLNSTLDDVNKSMADVNKSMTDVNKSMTDVNQSMADVNQSMADVDRSTADVDKSTAIDEADKPKETVQ